MADGEIMDAGGVIARCTAQSMGLGKGRDILAAQKWIHPKEKESKRQRLHLRCVTQWRGERHLGGA